MKNKYSYLAKNVLLFLISGFVPKILAFILVPIYTSCLTTTEYGISDLLTTTVALFVPLFTLDIQDAVARYVMDDAYKKEDVFSSAMWIILSGTGIISIVTLVVSMLNIDGLYNSYLLFFVIMYFTTAAHNSMSLFCRGIDKVDVIVVSSIINSLITLLTNIIFLVYFKMGLKGYLLANILGTVVALIWCFFRINAFKYIRWKFDRNVFKEMIKYSFPLIFSVISWWINNASDRYILSLISGVAVSGIYAVAYKIPSLLTIFQNIFFQAWSISAIKEFDRNDSDGFIVNIYTMINGGMVILCSCIMVVNIPLAKILYSNEFFVAWKYVPPLLVSIVLNAMALFIGGIFTAVKDTKALSISTICGAVINTICNVVLIYFFGAYGAALATLLGYAIVLIIRHINLRKYIYLKINWKRDCTAYVALIIQMFISLFGINSILLQVLITVIIFLLFRKELMRIINKLFKNIFHKS